MKNVLLVILTLFSLTAFATNNPIDGKLNVNIKSSDIAWKGYKVTGEHDGNVKVKSGELSFQDGMLTGGSFLIDMGTITNNDLEGEWNQKLVGHLKSDDFFGVSSYPTAKFVITKAIPYGTDGSYKIVGKLTIKENTREIKFNADVRENDGEIVATAKMVVDRSEFDVRYGSGSFFDNLGDKTIYDEFDLNVKLVASK